MEYSYFEQKFHSFCSIYDTAWTGYKCIAYVHIAYEKRKKLDDKGEKCIFLGVSDQSKAYKLYNPSTKKILISCDVSLMKKKPGSIPLIKE